MRRVPILCLIVANTLCCRSELARPEPVERAPSTLVKNTMAKLESRVAPPATESMVSLPSPQTQGGLTVAAALAKRRSHRDFAALELTSVELAQLAWAAQGVTEPVEGLRTAPSAGALYPLELYFVTKAGLLHYLPTSHAFKQRLTGDLREELANSALQQQSLRLAPCTAVITAVPERTARKYGTRATRYVAIEAGHAAQNLLLEATSHGLVGVPIGAFEDDKLGRLLGLQPSEEPLYLIAIGHPQR